MLKTGKVETVFENGFKSSGILSKQSTVGPVTIPSHSMTTPLPSLQSHAVTGQWCCRKDSLH